jgi:hypothetical protein
MTLRGDDKKPALFHQRTVLICNTQLGKMTHQKLIFCILGLGLDNNNIQLDKRLRRVFYLTYNL